MNRSAAHLKFLPWKLNLVEVPAIFLSIKARTCLDRNFIVPDDSSLGETCMELHEQSGEGKFLTHGARVFGSAHLVKTTDIADPDGILVVPEGVCANLFKGSAL